MCELPGKTANQLKVSRTASAPLLFGAGCMGRIAQPEHGAYSLNVCPAFESRGFAPVLLAFVLGKVFFPPSSSSSF